MSRDANRKLSEETMETEERRGMGRVGDDEREEVTG